MFKVRVNIYSRRGGNNIRKISDRGRFINDLDGILKFQLLKRRVKLKPPSQQDVILTGKILIKEEVNLGELDTGLLVPIPLKFDSKIMNFIPDDIDVMFWASLANKETNATYDKRGWFEKHGALISIFVVAMFCLASIVIFGDWVATQTETNLQAQQRIADAISTALTVLKGA